MKSLTKALTKAYILYFGYQVGNQDKSWVPHVCCTRYTKENL